MTPPVPLDPLQIALLDDLAGSLRAVPSTWPAGAQASARRVAEAMTERRMPMPEDLCRVLFMTLDADRMSGYLADRALGVRPDAVQRAREEAVHVRLGLPVGTSGTTERIEGASVYFPNF